MHDPAVLEDKAAPAAPQAPHQRQPLTLGAWPTRAGPAPYRSPPSSTLPGTLWSVSFSGPGLLETAWPPFLAGADIDPAEPRLSERVHALQVLRVMEQLASGNLAPGITGIVTDRLRAALT